MCASVVLDVLFPIKLQYFFMVAHSDLKAKVKKKFSEKRGSVPGPLLLKKEMANSLIRHTTCSLIKKKYTTVL